MLFVFLHKSTWMGMRARLGWCWVELAPVLHVYSVLPQRVIQSDNLVFPL